MLSALMRKIKLLRPPSEQAAAAGPAPRYNSQTLLMNIFVTANLHLSQFHHGNQMKMSKQCYLCLRQNNKKGDVVTPPAPSKREEKASS